MAQKQKVPSDRFGQNHFLVPLDSSRWGASNGTKVYFVAATSKTLQEKNCPVLKRESDFCYRQRVLRAYMLDAKRDKWASQRRKRIV